MIPFLNSIVKNVKILQNTQKIVRFCHGGMVNNVRKEQHQQNCKKGQDGHYDVIIVGGGTVGLSMACSISKNPMLCDKRVLLLDGAPSFQGFNKDLVSNRVFSINEGTVDLMKSIDAWDTICSIRCQPIKQMQVWDALSDAYINFDHADFSKNVAYVVENDVILYAVLQELEKSENVQIRNNSKIENIMLATEHLPNSLVELKDGQQFSCEMLIGADGANSLVRDKMEIDYFSLNYEQMGLIATVELRDMENGNDIAWQRFLPDGVLALLPISNSLSSIVWSTDTKKVRKLLSSSEEEFVDALNNAFWTQHSQNEIVRNAMKGVMSLIGNLAQRPGPLPPNIKGVYHKSRAAFPLGFGHSSSYVANGVALIGDSAHRVHPLAGQGLNLGFGDVKDLTDVLAQAAYDGALLGNIQHLSTYEQKRLIHNVPIMLGIHGLQKLYGTTFSPVVLMRSIGLQMTHAITPVKKLFMEKAMY